jgi:hypothetical protein
VTPRDAAALASAVVDASRAGMPGRAIAWVRERFSAERMVAGVAALYEELLSPDYSRKRSDP